MSFIVKYQAVQSILTTNINLMYAKGKVTDCSGRIFSSISAFEYALWALDKQMWVLMLKSIPKSEEGKKALNTLSSQYDQVNGTGVTYKQNKNTVTERHFDFENTIIKELQIQVDSLKASRAKHCELINKQWREGVGGAQRLLPMYVIYSYCCNDPFYSVTVCNFGLKSFQQFYNWVTHKNEDWFSADSKLGVNFAIYKSYMGGAEGSPKSRGLWASCIDLAAMKTLLAGRTRDFINLKLEFKEQKQIDNQCMVFEN